MDINELTVGQVKEMLALFGGAVSPAAATHPFVGKYCIIRCTGAGVHAGTLVSVDGDTAIVSNARNLWQWTAAGGIALAGVARYGLAGGKLDAVTPEIHLTGVCAIIPCSAKAREDIENAK